MKNLRQFIFTLVAVLGLSLAVSAQKDDKKPKPPKPKPPVVEPGDKNPPKGNPPKGDQPKKPQTAWLFALRQDSDAGVS